jgi:hypothetical protein
MEAMLFWVDCTDFCAPAQISVHFPADERVTRTNVYPPSWVVVRDAKALLIHAVVFQMFPGDLRFESAADEESQAKHILSETKDDITVFKIRGRKIHRPLCQEALQLLWTQIQPRLCRPWPECLNEPCGGFYKNPDLLKSLQPGHPDLEPGRQRRGRALFEEPPALLMGEKQIVLELRGGNAEAVFHVMEKKTPLILACRFWP